jgi:hypothetical protein
MTALLPRVGVIPIAESIRRKYRTMKQFRILTILVTLMLLVSACGAEPAPTVNPADVQSTAVAAALTIIAQTQAAIPTETPLPPTPEPTFTSLPTSTPLELPTLEQLPTIAPTTASGGDPCETRVLGAPKGKATRIRIDNATKVAITVSLYLNPTSDGRNVNPNGECGYRSYNIGKNGNVVIDDLIQGCYNLWAWSDDPKGRFRSSGYGCINNPDKWGFEVTTAVVKFNGP